MIRYHKSVKEYKRIKTPYRDQIPVIILYIGPTGCGKTTTARREYPNAYWLKTGNWWEDYDGQKTVIFDEFTGAAMKFRQLLQILDSAPMKVECKGGAHELVATTFVFTSNFMPFEWYSETAVHHTWPTSPLKRRIDEWGTVYWMGAQGANPVYRPGVSQNLAHD